MNHKKNGLTNGSATITKSPRTSPKFFKNHRDTTDGQFLINNHDKSTDHSITVSSQPAPSNHQQQQKFSTQLNHLACENGINNNTGIKQAPINGKSHSITHKIDKLRTGLNGKVQSRKHEKAVKGRTNGKGVRKSKHEKLNSARYSMKSRAKSQNVVVEPVPLASLYAPEVQSKNHLDLDLTMFYAPPLSPRHHLESETVQKLSRDERLMQRKIQLRHRVEQFKGIQRYRTTERSRMRFSQALRLLKHLDRAKEEM